MSSDIAFSIDLSLLRLVEEAVTSEGYEVIVQTDDVGMTMILAENDYFMVAATAVGTVKDLASAEPYLVDRLSVAVSSEGAGPKRWDAYAVLLTQQTGGNDDDLSRLFELAYDTSGVRRIVQAGVHPDLESVRRAIVPFVRPPDLLSRDLAADPLEQLEQELERLGSDPLTARRALDVYRAGGGLSDVF
jgi:hypothetical protein